MKKILSLVLAAVVLAAVLALPAAAETYLSEKVRVLMSTPEITVTGAAKCVPAKELADAIEDGEELIGEECKLDAKRISVLQCGSVACEDEVNYVTFKVWSTAKRTIALFFMEEDGEDWQLLSCNLGDVIEGCFEADGQFAIVVGW